MRNILAIPGRTEIQSTPPPPPPTLVLSQIVTGNEAGHDRGRDRGLDLIEGLEAVLHIPDLNAHIIMSLTDGTIEVLPTEQDILARMQIAEPETALTRRMIIGEPIPDQVTLEGPHHPLIPPRTEILGLLHILNMTEIPNWTPRMTPIEKEEHQAELKKTSSPQIENLPRGFLLRKKLTLNQHLPTLKWTVAQVLQKQILPEHQMPNRCM